jgi:prophage tail gpP-like protein
MGPELVTVRANSALWSAFEKIEVHASFNHAVRSFSIHGAAEPGPTATAWTFKAGTEIDILFNGDLAVRGYVDRYQPQLGEHKTAKFVASGRGKGQDFCDCAALHATGEFLNKTPLEIAQALDAFGVGITSDVQLDPVPVARITPGETAFRTVEKLLRAQGKFFVGQADGTIKITQAGSARHAGGIFEGINLKAGHADHDWSKRHSKIIVRGQRPFDHGDANLQIEATAEDNDVTRYRPTLVVHDGDLDAPRAKKRASYRRDREAGRSLKGNAIRLQGFRDDAGKLWEPGFLVWTESPFLDITQDMAIEGVRFTQTRKPGSESVLSLVDPRALGGKRAAGAKAGAAWGTTAGENDPSSLDPALSGQ